ncbi:MAG: hypothetical protein RIT25_248 [Planctomycetota bacterium]
MAPDPPAPVRGACNLRLHQVPLQCTLRHSPRVLPMGESAQLDFSILDRIDLAMASRYLQGSTEPIALAQRVSDRLLAPCTRDTAWIASILQMRGLLVLEDDVREILEARPGRLAPSTQEHGLVLGLHRVLQMMREVAGAGQQLDGCFLMAAFEAMTSRLPRFRNNVLRRDKPWDSMLHVSYPEPGDLDELLRSFQAGNRYRDLPHLFDAMHPVRRAIRILWRAARIAPFPDFNLPMAWIAMCTYLQCSGYPRIAPRAEDTAMLQKLVSGPPPLRSIQVESRVLEAIESL